ncbi:MAG: hypothetical protein MI923_11240 [Phycisphaerales bacterium]|nr:hypothetical protein [Phycisphaerales bacterium]
MLCSPVGAADRTWGGATDTIWGTASNWPGPGKPGASDNAFIDDDTVPNFPQVDVNASITNVTMSDGTLGTPLTLTVDSSVTLTGTGSYTIENQAADGSYVEKLSAGELDFGTMAIDATNATSNGKHVTFKHSAGTVDINGTVTMDADTDTDSEVELFVAATGFDANDLDVNGGNSIDREAVLNFDESVTLTAGATPTFDGFVALDVATAKTFTARAVTIGGPAGETDLDFTGNGTFKTDTMTIQGGDASNEPTQLVMNNCDLDADGLVTVTEGTATSSTGDSAKLEIGAIPGTATIHSMELIGQAILDFDVAVTIENEFKISGDVANKDGVPSMTLGANDDLTVGSFKIVGPSSGSLSFTPTLGANAEITTN